MRYSPYKRIFIAVLLLVSHSTAFFFGYLLLETKAVVALAPEEFTPPSPRILAEAVGTKITPKIVAAQIPNLPNKDISPSDKITYSHLNHLIEDLHPQQLNSYLSKYFDKGDLEKINDRERFAQRLVDLYSGEDSVTEQQWDRFDAEMAVGISENYPQQPINHLSIASEENKIYAHLKLNQSPSFLAEGFVRWQRMADNKLLLFEKKIFDPTSNTHWVSLIPQDGWQDGEYHVDFYSFDSQMQPIASLSYFLNILPKSDN